MITQIIKDRIRLRVKGNFNHIEPDLLMSNKDTNRTIEAINSNK